MKTMKIIELLNKIANGEDVPRKVKYNNEIYCYEKDETDYYGDGTYLFYKGFENNTEMFLKNEIEIIEDTDNKIEKIDVRYGLKQEDVGFENETYLLAVVGEQATKINELIDYINNNHIPRID